MDARTPIFLYDLGSPECYLAAERVSYVLPVAPRWEPVLGQWRAGHEWKGEARPVFGHVPELGPQPVRAEIERIARERGLQAIRWPRRWPPDSRLAMRAATYAKAIGRATAFSLAAFRQAFAAGRDLGDPDTIMIAGAACEMHPAALTRAVESRSVTRALEEAGARAAAAGVNRLPALTIGRLVFQGDSGVDEAAALLAAR